MLVDSDLSLHRGGELYIFKAASISLILPLIDYKYVVLSPVPNGMIYNANHFPTARTDV